MDTRFQAFSGGMYNFVEQSSGKIVYENQPLSRLNADGTPDTSFSFLGGTTSLLTLLTGNELLVLKYVDSKPDKILRLDENGMPDKSFQIYKEDFPVVSAASLPDGRIYIGGFYAPVRSLSYKSVLIRLEADGTKDDNFGSYIQPLTEPLGYGVNQIEPLPVGKILLSGFGYRDMYNQGRGVIRVDAYGNLDESFRYDNTSPCVRSFVIQPDGKILVGAAFYEEYPLIFRLNPDGSRDVGFNANATLEDGPDNPALATVNSLVVQPDGKVIVGGRFDHVNGVARKSLARLNADGTLDESFVASDPVGTVLKLLLHGDGTLLTAGQNGLVKLYAYTPGVPQVASKDIAATVGSPFSTRIDAINNPISYTADGLLEGLSLEAVRGIITGAPEKAGVYPVAVSATNSAGTDMGTLTITVGSLVVTLTAPIRRVEAGSGGQGEFAVNLSAPQDHNVFVRLSFGGNAEEGTDYAPLKTIQKIKTGEMQRLIKVNPVGNAGGPGGRRVVATTLEEDSGYTVGTTGKVKVVIKGR